MKNTHYATFLCDFLAQFDIGAFCPGLVNYKIFYNYKIIYKNFEHCILRLAIILENSKIFLKKCSALVGTTVVHIFHFSNCFTLTTKFFSDAQKNNLQIEAKLVNI